jgi:hypothetical protein
MSAAGGGFDVTAGVLEGGSASSEDMTGTLLSSLIELAKHRSEIDLRPPLGDEALIVKPPEDHARELNRPASWIATHRGPGVRPTPTARMASMSLSTTVCSTVTVISGNPPRMDFANSLAGPGPN